MSLRGDPILRQPLSNGIWIVGFDRYTEMIHANRINGIRCPSHVLTAFRRKTVTETRTTGPSTNLTEQSFVEVGGLFQICSPKRHVTETCRLKERLRSGTNCVCSTKITIVITGTLELYQQSVGIAEAKLRRSIRILRVHSILLQPRCRRE